jgi:hypothetical protein
MMNPKKESAATNHMERERYMAAFYLIKHLRILSPDTIAMRVLNLHGDWSQAYVFKRKQFKRNEVCWQALINAANRSKNDDVHVFNLPFRPVPDAMEFQNAAHALKAQTKATT